MPHNFTKRIKNVIRKDSKGYHLTTSRSFVPNKGSIKMFHGSEVNPVQNIVTVYGTAPALKNLKSIYETEMSKYYKTMLGHKKMKRRLNRHYRTAIA